MPTDRPASSPLPAILHMAENISRWERLPSGATDSTTKGKNLKAAVYEHFP